MSDEMGESMSEEILVQETPEPRTRESLVADLRRLGVVPGMTLLVHSSLRAVGWVAGGAVAVVQALQDVLTELGTLVVPTQTGNYSDPAQWSNPPVPQEWWPLIYEGMPAFDPALTPSYLMGQIAETVRTWPGTLRSNHPMVSFAAWGRHARYITANHSLDYGLGEGSPLARIYELNGAVLLLGVGYNRNTSMHLAEYRVPDAKQERLGSPIYEYGRRVWKWYADIEIDADIFPQIGRDFEREGRVDISLVGSAQSRLMSQRELVDFAVEWYLRKREEEQGSC